MTFKAAIGRSQRGQAVSGKHHPAPVAAGASENRHAEPDLSLLFACLFQRRPAHRLDRVRRGLSHQVSGFAGKKDLNFVASLGQSPCRKGNDARVGSSDPQALFIMILSGLWICVIPWASGPKNGSPASCDKNNLRYIYNDILLVTIHDFSRVEGPLSASSWSRAYSQRSLT
jgi:hypothetical protein